LTEGFHAFDSSYRAADTFKIALYTSSASLDPSTTTVYTSVGEVVGTGYTAGGQVLTAIPPQQYGTTAYWSFNNALWVPATFVTAGALIYNATQGNRAVSILFFGGNKTASNTFTVQFPTNGATSSVLRLY
jgi:hypothetical protein